MIRLIGLLIVTIGNVGKLMLILIRNKTKSVINDN